ncbi:MAG: sarcosine oxidase subunit alpha family protein [Rhizobiales bacterium]|nr:sarcosine oxidase subunit alpha family protein [Hyphomicrobiales bacterium]
MSGFRLNSGGQVDRSTSVRFRFDGSNVTGFEGDTIASALLANGQSLFGRSFKYHRPRGVYTAGSEEPNALVNINRGGVLEPNTRATMSEIFDGLSANSQNRWPSLSFDVLSINQFAGPLLQAGFYYKTFMGPTRKAWRVYEHFIRRAAGLGTAGKRHDTDRYEKLNVFADLLIVGGGLAGLNAAHLAGTKGARVVLVDEHPEFGGYHRGNAKHIADIDELVRELRAMDNVTVLSRTTCFGAYDGNTFGMVERVSGHIANASSLEPFERYHVVRATHAIYACGALERPITFPDNDRRGIMLADSIRAYAYRYGVSPGKSIAFFTNNDGAYTELSALKDLGVPIHTMIDTRTEISDASIAQIAASGVNLITGHAVTGVRGSQNINQISLAPYDAYSKSVSGTPRTLDCDCLAVSGGWTPSIHLTSQMGGAPIWDEMLQAFLPGKSDGGWTACGTMAGHMSSEEALASAEAVTEPILRKMGFSKGRKKMTVPKRVDVLKTNPVWKIDNTKGKAFVDFQHDVTSADILLAHREGFHSVEHMKRYTTLGMATDQGKLSNINGLALMADARKLTLPEVGTTRFRPPYSPVAMGALAADLRGAHWQPVRRTAMHYWHEENGADMMDVGLWKRPRIYRESGETMEIATIREARKTREAIGIIDVSTLGKIAVQGPDAAEFLNHIYSNGFAKLPVGKARYGLMLREDGIVFDDGTTWRLTETDYLMTTTTAKAGDVMELLETYLALHWPDLKVHVTSVTDQWSGAAIAGPKVRDLLSKTVTDVDFSNDSFPFMAIRHGTTKAGIPVMICRLSFSGELAFEVYSQTRFGLSLWNELQSAGENLDLVTYGMEALNTLRIEKGHVVGAELNGRTSGEMVGLGGMVSRKKSNYIGAAMVDREGYIDPHRQQMVGLISKNGESIKIGCHLVRGEDKEQPGLSLGHVTSCAYSPALEKYVALALLSGGKSMIGQQMFATYPLKGTHFAVEVVDPCFFDKEGERMHG